MNDLLARVDKIFDSLFLGSLPSFSKKTREMIVGIMPWLVLILALIALPGLLAVFGLGAVTTPFAMLFGRSVGWFWLGWVVGAVQVALEIMAIQGLFARKKRGWMLLYYSSLLGIVMAVVSLSIVGFLITMAIMYMLYQIRSSYK